MRVLLSACLLLLVLAPASGRAALAVEYVLEAEVAPDLSTIEGSLRATIRNEGTAPLDQLVLWLYPNLFTEELAGVTDVNRQRYAPWGAGSGGIELDRVEVGGQPAFLRPLAPTEAPARTANGIPLDPPLPPGGVVELTLRFATTVPHRLGPFSRAHGVLTALGGWHPWVTAPAARPVDRQPPPADYRITLRLPEDHVALVGGARPDRHGRVELRSREWADLVVRPARVRPVPARGGAVWPLESPPDDGWEKGSVPDPRALPSAWAGDELAALLASLDRWSDSLPLLPPAAPVQLVVVPLRSEIAIATPGIVAVSDRAYRVTPLRAIQVFHDQGIARAYFAHRLLPLARRCESPARARQVADGMGAVLAHRFTEEVLGGTADAAGLLGRFDFIPTVDAFLRSPRSDFAHVYFQPVADPIPVRDEPWTFNDQAPRGKLLLARLEDRLGGRDFGALVDAWLAGEACPLQEAAEVRAGAGLEPFFRAWSESVPRQDLRVRILSTEELPGDRWRTEVEVRRIGDAPPDVIETAAWEDDGARHLLVWQAELSERVRIFDVVAERPITRLHVDPRGRVPQTPADPGEVPALGDRVPSRIQVLLTRFSLSYSTADNALFGDVDFLLRPREAVRRRLGVGASWRRARLEARTSLNFGFGELVDAARYEWNWGVGLSADYLRAGFAGEETVEGFAVGPLLVLAYDDRPPAMSPLRGTAFFAAGSTSAGASRGGATNLFGSVAVGAVRLFPLGPRSALAVRLKGNLVLGEAPIQELIPLGGSDEGLRGFPLESVLSERRAIASVEWRHPLLVDLDVDVLFGRIGSISGALFADGAWAGGLYPLAPNVPEQAFFADVGYGLRAEYDLLGVRPLLFGVDAAIPINRGAAVPGTGPVVFTVRAAQAFATP